MDNLLSLQNNFLESFQGIGSFENHIKINGVSPKNRLSIYKNNITQALLKALALTYPLTWKLIGEDCANGAAYAFVQEGTFLPRMGNLDEWGADFPHFLEQFLPTQNLAYLPDFVKLEWLKHRAYCAENVSSLNALDFKDMDPENYVNLVLKLHPSVQLLSSPYSLDQVMAVVEGEVDSIKLENQKSNALIIRPNKSVNIHWVSENYYTFFSFISDGAPLMKVLEKIPEAQSQFHDILSFSLQNGLFSEYVFTSS